jgi:hypothetical protein
MAFLGIGGSKPKSLDVGQLYAQNLKNKQALNDLTGQKNTQLTAGYAPYEAKRNAISAQLQPGAENLLSQYGTDLSKVNEQQQAANTASANQVRQEQFRNVPEIQRSIRDSLAGNRLMGSGAALSTLAKPTIQAAQNSADFAANQESQRLADVAKRTEGFATTGFNTRQKALADKLGMDEDTLNTLTQMGRTDLVDKFNELSGAQEQFGANELAINQAGQMSDIARQNASNAQKSAIMGTLGSVAGGAAGFGLSGGNPMGAALGMQAGGSLGSMAGGGTPQQLDPTLMFALMQRNAVQKTPTGRSSFGRQAV